MWFLAHEILPEHRARSQLLGVEPHPLHDLLHNALLVVLVEDGKAAREALVANFQRLNIASQNPHAERVKCCDERLGQRAVAQQPVDALAHLAGRFVGKGHGQNRIRRDALFFDQPRNPAGNHARLARAGAGKYQQRPFGGLNRGALFRIQIGEEWEQDMVRTGSFLL